jgi:thymidylate synthase
MEMKNQNNIEHQYLKLLKDILDNGVEKQDRTGTGTISVFGRQIRHDMKLGFPLLTTKKMPFKTITTELLWFLRGDTNIKYLVDNNCHIWDGDAYKNYCNKCDEDKWMKEITLNLPFPNKSYGLYSQEEFIDKIKTDDDFAKKWGELGPVYGAQWRNWLTYKPSNNTGSFYQSGNIDQIHNLINDLKTNPDSRRLMVNAWNVSELDQMVLPPCHYGFQVYTRELSFQERLDIYDPQKLYHNEVDSWFLDKLNIPTRAISLMWSQRSCDVPLGIPFNIASYALLLELLAKMTNMVPDELIGNLGDTHIYHNQVDGIKEQLTREPYQLPKLNINTEWWPTESGECGEGPIDAQAVLEGFSNDNFCKCLIEEDIQLGNYKYHPTIKMPLSN